MELWIVGVLSDDGRLMEPPAGAAPAELFYKRSSQAAAWRRNGRSLRCRPGHDELMKLV
jgi:hypothetical protein